jgi:hypothetical protein
MIRWLVFPLLLVFLPASEVVAAPTSAPAMLTALEGAVSVVRSGTLIPSDRIDEGFPLEDFDTILTGHTGHAEVRVSAATGVAATVRLDNDTSLYLDVSVLKTEQTAGVELLAGGVTVQVASVQGRSVVEVRTDTGAFSQAGPGFRVVMAPSGETLVTARAGSVSCRVGNRVVTAEPGTVVEASAGVKTIPVNVSTLDAYESGWLSNKKQFLRDQSSLLFRLIGTRYQLQVSQFQRAWDRNQREAAGPPRAILAATADLRRSAYPLERSMPRVQALRKLFDEGLIAPGFELSRGYTAKDFFKAWDQESADWNDRLTQARAFYKSVVESSGGQFPGTSDIPAITYTSDYFH